MKKSLEEQMEEIEKLRSTRNKLFAEMEKDLKIERVTAIVLLILIISGFVLYFVFNGFKAFLSLF